MIEKNTHVSPGTCCILLRTYRSVFLSLALYLEERNLHYAMVAPLELKKSLGITRGKNDKVDSARIADYARRFGDRVPLTKLPAKGHPEDSLLAEYERKTRQEYARTSGYVQRNPARHEAF